MNIVLINLLCNAWIQLFYVLLELIKINFIHFHVFQRWDAKNRLTRDKLAYMFHLLENETYSRLIILLYIYMDYTELEKKFIDLW